MKEISKKEEQRIIEALEAAVKMANDGSSPDEALTKTAEDYEFPPEIIKRMTEAFNTSKTLSHLKAAGELERGDSFPIASPEVILGKLFPQEPETEVTKSASAKSDEYKEEPTDLRFLIKESQVEALPPLTDKTAEPYARDPSYEIKKAQQDHAKLIKLAESADGGFRTVYFRLLGALDKAAALWHNVNPVEPFGLVEKRAAATYGDVGKTIMDMIYAHGDLSNSRLNVKRASAEDMGTQEMFFDETVEPYSTVSNMVFLANEMNRIRKEAAEIKSAVDKHAVANIHLLPPQPVYNAIERFMKLAEQKKDMPDFTDQDRPAKVKEIYSALKRDNPDMAAGTKARIAESTYNKMDEKKAALDDMFVKE